MNKFLRYSFVALLAMMFGNSFGQEVTLDFTSNDAWKLPEGSSNKATAEATFTNGKYSIKLAAATGYYYNTDGYLMLGKQGSTLTLPAFDFDVERIDVVGTSNASTSTLQNIYVGDQAVSTQTKGAQGTNKYEIAADYQAAGNVYVFKVESAHNTQITKILVWKKGTTTEDKLQEVTSIADFTALGSGTEAILAFNNAQITYVSGKYVYVRDNTGGMCFYNQSALSGATNKWQLNGKIQGKVSIYNGLTQMTVTDASALTHTEGDAYQPVSIAASDAASHIADLVKLTDEITIFADGGKFYTSEDKSLQIYDNFKLNYQIATGDKISGLTGVVIPYNNQLEIAPTEAPTATGIDVVKAAAQQNGAIYNLKGQRVTEGYKGLVIKNGKKVIMK